MSRWDRKSEGQRQSRQCYEERRSCSRSRSRSRSASQSPSRSRSRSRSMSPLERRMLAQEKEQRRRQAALERRGHDIGGRTGESRPPPAVAPKVSTFSAPKLAFSRSSSNSVRTGSGSSGSRAAPSPQKPKAPVGIQMKLAPAARKEQPKLAKPVANAFCQDDDSDDEPEEMPAECRMRMRNIGRETPTSSGPNSFGKTKHGFCDSKKMLEKKLSCLSD